MTASQTVIECRSNRIIPLIVLIALFITEMFNLIMGTEIFLRGSA